MPATRAEFAAQILKSVSYTPPPSTPPPSTKPRPTALSSTDQQLRPPLEPRQANCATVAETPAEPANRPPNKKSYQVRLHTNMPVTGSPPPWGWTTDPYIVVTSRLNWIADPFRKMRTSEIWRSSSRSVRVGFVLCFAQVGLRHMNFCLSWRLR
jgi:hypothetical protein